jgi:hypothetical protein
MLLQRGMIFTHEAVQEWERKLTPFLTRWEFSRYAAERYVGSRGRRGVLPLRLDGNWSDPGPPHHGWPRCLPTCHPDRLWRPGDAPAQPLLE